MRHKEEKIAGNTRNRGEKQWRARVGAGYFESALVVYGLLKSADGAGLHRADIAQEAQVAVAALQASWAMSARCSPAPSADLSRP